MNAIHALFGPRVRPPRMLTCLLVSVIVAETSPTTPSEIVSGLWVGGIDSCQHSQFDLVVSAALTSELESSCQGSLRLELSDQGTENISLYLDRVSDVITKFFDSNPEGRVLVHCVQGRSRSPSLLLAYLVKGRNMDLKEAWALVKQKRPCVRPRFQFFEQLMEFERRIRGKVTVSHQENYVPINL